MKTTANFLDDLQRKFDLPSDYAVSKLLGMHRQQVSHYRKKKGTFDDEISVRVAELLGINAGYVMACMQAQRAKNPTLRRTWEKAAATLAGTAVAILAGCTLAMAPLPHLVPSASAAPGLYIMLNAVAVLILGALLGMKPATGSRFR
jgi:hypothetical protein